MVQVQTLFSHHRKMLEASGISNDVIEQRGYRSIQDKAELKKLGFATPQCCGRGLLMPIWGVDGQVVLHQFRPDVPRLIKDKAVKYETAHGAKMALDVPPTVQKWIGDPSRPLIITEGVKKADAAVSRGLCCIALLGVWNWRGQNEQGGLTALAAWENIALKGREVYICFDSDVMTKPSVHASLKRLKAFLESRGA